MKNTIIVLFALLVIMFFPLISIWAVNTLFGTAIPFTLATWFASFWLTVSLATKYKN